MRLTALLALVLCLSLPSSAEPPSGKAAPPKAQRRSRLDIASSGWGLALGRYKSGAGTIEQVAQWSQWLYEAERATDPRQAAAHRVTRLTELEDTVSGRISAGGVTQLDLFVVQYLLATAQADAP